MRYDHFSMLPEQAFQPRGGFRAGGMTLEGGGSGGGSPPPSQTTQTTTTIPEYARPYMERLLGKAEAASKQPYQTYGGDRIAGPSVEQLAARQEIFGMETPGQFGIGSGLTGAGGLGALGAGQQYMSMATDPSQMQAFMSPYQQAVTDVAKASAMREAQMAQRASDLAAGRRAGALGSSGNILAQAERERGTLDRMAQLQAEGSQKAFEAAQQAQQFGADLGLRGYGQAIQAGQGLGQLGAMQQAAQIERLQQQEQFGALGQAEKQRALDLAYSDFLNQQRHPYTQLGFMSDILRGSGNLATTGGQAVYTAPPSLSSQIGGLGLAGLGLYQLMK